MTPELESQLVELIKALNAIPGALAVVLPIVAYIMIGSCIAGGIIAYIVTRYR